MTKKYIIYSALSGCVWDIIALALTLMFWRWPPTFLIGGVAISPLIGISVGLVYLPAYRLSKILQVFVSLLTMYLAVALFGLGIGLYGVFWNRESTVPSYNSVIQSVLQCIWGVTVFGWIVILWPLSYLNHRLLSIAVAWLD